MRNVISKLGEMSSGWCSSETVFLRNLLCYRKVRNGIKSHLSVKVLCSREFWKSRDGAYGTAVKNFDLVFLDAGVVGVVINVDSRGFQEGPCEESDGAVVSIPRFGGGAAYKVDNVLPGCG